MFIPLLQKNSLPTKTALPEVASSKRAAALQATLELIAEQGLQATPMSQVAERANIGVGTIYRYFANKDELINALYLDIKERIARYSLQGYKPTVPVPDNLKLLLKNVVHFFLTNPSAFLFLEQYENSPHITATTRQQGMQYADPIVDIFKQAKKQKLLKDLPVELLGALMSGAVIGLAKLYLSQNRTIKDPALDASLDAIWDLLRK